MMAAAHFSRDVLEMFLNEDDWHMKTSVTNASGS